MLFEIIYLYTKIIDIEFFVVVLGSKMLFLCGPHLCGQFSDQLLWSIYQIITHEHYKYGNHSSYKVTKWASNIIDTSQKPSLLYRVSLTLISPENVVIDKLSLFVLFIFKLTLGVKKEYRPHLLFKLPTFIS